MANHAAITALNSLLQNTAIEDHEEALRLANAAIKGNSNPDDLTPLHTKVVALLKLDRYDDVLRVVAGGGDRLAKECALEHAYALYKTGDLERAAAVARDLPGRAARHVNAQVAYRAERFDEAARSYHQLTDAVSREGRVGEEGDLRINMLAAAAQLEWAGRSREGRALENEASRIQYHETFETAFNTACSVLAQGDLVGAAQALKRAKDLCEASEDLSEEERQAELVPIVVQQTCVLLKLGKVNEAAQVQESISVSQISDRSIKQVAQNNSLVLSQDESSYNGSSPYNPYMAARLAESHEEPTGNDRLFEHQASVLRRNKHIIELQCQKFTGARSATAQALQKRNIKKGVTTAADAEAANLGVLHAAAVAHMQTGKEALKSILPLLETRPDDIGLLLTIIQLYVQTNNPGPALSLLEALFRRLETATNDDHSDVRFAPGLVALAVALYRLQGRHNAVRTELAKASAYWQQQAANTGVGRRNDSAMSVLRQAGVELLQSPHPSDLSAAGAAFSHLCTEQPDDLLAEAGLVASFATNSSERSRVQPSYLEHMTPVDQLTAGVNVQALINAGVASLPAPGAPTATTAPKSKKRGASTQEDGAGAASGGATTAAPPAKKPRQRKSKLPKDFDPDKKPDPERWLPLKDRSTYRPKGGKKGKKRAEANTQGGVVHEETIELVGGAGAVKVEKAPQSAPAKKSKKKGKK